ncbi:nucleocapsid [Lasius niger]|uniref:Nucleocapsid n=1 Tax=Lasius niger TaxID=67767 RepID=A0A0J7JXF2_LASNI|nr:nucleocapsid [Lasius niger]
MMAAQEPQNYVAIERIIRIEETQPAKYVNPPQSILTKLPLEEGEAITTAIFWMLGKRPVIVQERHVNEAALDAQQKEALKNSIESPLSDQLLVFLGMAGVMTLVKEVRTTGPTANTEYLTKRWQAICATMGIRDEFAAGGRVTREMFDGMIKLLEAWQTWIKARANVRREILLLSIADIPDQAPDLVKKVLEQIKMVLYGYGLKSTEVMCGFTTSDSEALLIPQVNQQAVDLKRAVAELKEQHGPLYPYLRVFPLPGADRLHNRNYPDLYYAAVSTAVHNKDLGVEGRYQMTDVQTTTSKAVIDRMADRLLHARVGVDQVTIQNLAELGITLPRRRTGEEENDWVRDLAGELAEENSCFGFS